jgi:glycosyltransferase 2 family protein
VQIALGFGVSALAIFLLLQQVKPDELGPKLAQAQAVPIVIVVLGVLASLVTRAARWQIFFLPERRVPFVPLLETLAISYMASTFLPLRAGELVRALFLGLRESIAVPRVVGTILLEKLFDFLAIGMMLALLVALVPTRTEVQVGAGFIASVILIGFGFVVALAVWREPTLRLVGLIEARVPFGLGRRLRLEHAATQFAEGTDSLRVPRLWVPLLGWTAVTWACSLLTSWAGCLALGAEPGLAALLFMLVLTSSGQAVPSSPGYVGVYHYLAALALTTFGVDPATAIGIAIITHAFSYGPLVVAGLIALWTGGYTFGDVLAGVSGKGSRVNKAKLSTDPSPVATDP